MAVVNINTIKNWFKTGMIPTQAQFWSVFDSYRHKNDNIPVAEVEGINELLATRASQQVLDNHLAQKGSPNGYAPLDEFTKLAAQYLNIVNDLVTGGSAALLSAEMGKILKGQIDSLIAGSTPLNNVTTSSSIPETGNIYAYVGPGVYANWENVEVPENSIGLLSRFNDIFGVTILPIDLDGYIKKDTTNVALSTNIYIYDNSEQGYVDFNDGSVVGIPGWSASMFLPIKPNTVYTQYQGNQIAFYDSNKIYISGNIGSTKTYTTPANAAYFRIGVQNRYLPYFWIVEGTLQYAFNKAIKGFNDIGILSENVAGIDLKGLENNLRNKNIFDKSTVINGWYVAAGSGAQEFSGGNEYVTVPIRILGGCIYEFGDTLSQQYAIFDKNGLYISGYTGTVSKRFTTPHDGMYIKFTGNQTTINQQYLMLVDYVNMFDKYTQIADTYIGYGDGIAVGASNCTATGFLPVRPNTTYEFGSTAAQQYAFYDINKIYISGYYDGIGGKLKRITTPPGAEYIRFTTGTWDINAQYFIEIPKMNEVEIVKLTATPNASNWNSIRDLAMYCKQTASRFKKYEILVPNGTWNECDWGNFGEFVSIKGQDRYLTIINCDGTDTNVNHVVPGDYIGSGAYAGLQFAAVPKNWRHLVFMVSDLNVSNMTFRAKSCKYVAHIDSDTKFKNVLFENISFDEDDCNTPIGMGVWGGNNILFKYCSIKRALPGGLGVFFHNWNDQPEDSKTEFYGCKFKNCGYVDVQELGSQKNDYLILNSCKTDFVDISRYIVSSSSAYVPKTSTPYSIHVVVINTPGFIIDSYADRPLYLERNEF